MTEHLQPGGVNTPNITSKLGRCFGCLVRERGVCDALQGDELEHFSRISHARTFAPGEQILSSDQEPDFFAAITSGVVKLTKVLVDGRQQVVALLMPPDCIGRADGRQNPYFAEAATRTELCCFSRSAFEAMLGRFAGLRQRLLEQTLDELDEARDWMVVLGRKTAEERVASLLLMLATRARPRSRTSDSEAGSALPDAAATFELYLKRDEMADFLGLTYETVCRQISALRRHGVIELSGTRRFSVPNLAVLEKLCD